MILYFYCTDLTSVKEFYSNNFATKIIQLTEHFWQIYLRHSSTQGTLALKELRHLNVACGGQIWKKTFCQSSEKFGYSFI